MIDTDTTAISKRKPQHGPAALVPGITEAAVILRLGWTRVRRLLRTGRPGQPVAEARRPSASTERYTAEAVPAPGLADRGRAGIGGLRRATPEAGHRNGLSAGDGRASAWRRRRKTAADRARWSTSPLVAGAHLAVLWAFAVAEPLLDDLSRNAEFFVARDNTSADIVILSVGVMLVPPLALTALEIIASLAWPPLGHALHVGFLAVLGAALAVGVLKRVVPSETVVIISVAPMMGAALAVGYVSAAPLRTFLTALTPAPAVFLAVFLLFSPVSELVLRHETTASGTSLQSDTPVVLVIFDELPTISLMDGSGQIDAASYPSFGRLAATSTWYRNATTVADGTFLAVPAIFTGLRPAPRLPTSRQYPRSVFTLLGASYDVHALEPITQVCPSDVCARRPAEPAPARLRSLASDLSIVAAHVVLPADLGGGLPPIDRDYEDFGGAERGVEAPRRVGPAAASRVGKPPIAGTDVFAQRLRDAERFVQLVRPQTTRPPLYVAHFEVPHVPWRLLPSGHQYPVEGPSLPGLTDQTWTRNGYLVDQATQRHMLQVGYADRLLGRLIQRLQDAALWDRALVVVTADHGVGLRPGGSRRPVTRANFAAIAGIPLFIKLPQQRTARVDDGPAQTIDILPTIASVVGVPGGAGDGVPLTTTAPTAVPSVRNARRARFVSLGSLDAFVRARDAELARQRAIFPRGLASVFDRGPNRGLLGRRLAALRVRKGTQRAQIDASAAFAGVTRGSGVLPIYVTGQLRPGGPDAQSLAVAVNGRVRAVGRSYVAGARRRFSMLLPPSSLRPGVNTVDLIAVQRDGRLVRLAHVGP
jgi:hypothetical protein